MKKLLFFAAMMLGLASCQTEPEGLDVIVGGEVESFVNVSITETTRATSADSGLTNVNPAAYDLRYILEVYDKENDVFVYRDVKRVETDVTSVSFPVRLIPERDYNFVVWADFVEEDSDADLYYKTRNNGTYGLNAVTIAYDKWVAMDEARDAYTAVALVENYNSGKSINLDLIRPFGKLRVVTTDIKALEALAYDALPTDVRVEYKTKVYSGFNALTETANTEVTNATFAYNLAAVYDYDDYVDANTTSLTLFTDYIFGTTTGTIQFGMTVTYKNGNVATNNFNTEIPVKRNYLTTITGDILTDGNNIKVDVKDGFENAGGTDPDYEHTTISSAAELIDAINGQGGEYIVISNITISNAPTTLAATRATTNEPTEPTTTTIDLNGYTIKLKADIVVEAGKNIIITDTNENGEVGAIVSEDGGAIVNNGTLNIEGGHFGEDTIESNNGVVNITGGTFESNPSDFVDDDYIVVEGEDGKYTIERKPQDLIDFENAIENGGNVTLSDDITLLETVVIEEGNTVSLDLNGCTVTVPFVEGSTTNHLYAFDNKGTFTIKDTKGGGEIIARGIFNYGTMTLKSGIINACDGNGGYGVRNYEGAEFIMNDGSIVTSCEDDHQVDKGGYDATPLRVDNGAKATINGGTINNICDFTSAIENVGELVINGGNITSIHTTIYSTASVIINDATVTCNGLAGVTSHTIYTKGTGKVTINGGTFAHTAVDQNATGASVINGNVEVNAGTFTGRVESYNGTPVLKGGTFSVKPNDKFIAAGYKAVEVKGGYMVVPENVSVVYGDAVTAATLGKNKNATVYVMPNEDDSEIQLGGKLSIAEGVTLKGMGETPVKLFNDWGSNAFANQAHFTNTHIENIHFTNNLIIDAGIANGDVKFVNCVFGGDLAHQGVHFDSGNGIIIFENCTFVGRNMFGASLENVVFNNCTFLNKKSSLTGADKWTGVNMWGKYEFNNCTFDTEAHCNVKCDGVEATFKNCKYVDNRDITTIINNGSAYDATIKFE